MSGPDIQQMGRAACFSGVDIAPFDLYAALWRKVLNLEMNYADTNTGYVRNPATVLSIAINPALETSLNYIIDVHLAVGGWAWGDTLPPFGKTQADSIALCAGSERGVEDRFIGLPLTDLKTPVNEGYGDITHLFPTVWEVVVSGGAEDIHIYYAIRKIAVTVGFGIYGVNMPNPRALALVQGMYGLGMTAWPAITQIGLYHMQMTFADHSGLLVEAAYPGYARQPITIVADTMESASMNIFEPPGPSGSAPYNTVCLLAGDEIMGTAFFGTFAGQPAPGGGANWTPAFGTVYRDVFQLLAHFHLLPLTP